MITIKRIKGRYKIAKFLEEINPILKQMQPRMLYKVILRIYAPEKPDNTALLISEGRGENLIFALQSQLNLVKDREIVAFCSFAITQRCC